jgi:signal transduction histidine kinase
MPTDELPQPDLRLLANFVHQLINPLNGVIGTVDNLIDGSIPPDRKEQRLKATRAQLEFAVMMVRNLAYFTEQSLTPGTLPTRDFTKTCVIPQLVIEAAQFFQESGMSRGVKIELTDSKTQYAIQGSPELIRQVFMNIFDNAVKYSDPGSDVTVKPWVQKKRKALIVEICNIGPGFSNEESKTIFNPGIRGQEARNLIASGTGLGLSICKMIVEDYHKGVIEAEYSPATRTVTIRLRFPKWRIT